MVQQQFAKFVIHGMIALTIAIAGVTGVAALRSSQANAAPSVDATPPLTISRKPLSSLSSQPGIRIAKISSQEGETCFRASRNQANGGRTISETFCRYE